jgi:hypothetical protein
MKQYKLLIPNIVCTYALFHTIEQAEKEAKALLNKKTANYRFISLLHNEQLLTIYIKPGYELYSFKSFKYLDEIGKISDFFILHQDQNINYYIKIKK